MNMMAMDDDQDEQEMLCLFGEGGKEKRRNERECVEGKEGSI